MEKQDKIQLLKESIPAYPDFPQPGVLFRDIFGVFKNVTAIQAMKDLLIEHVALLDVDYIVGLESRGFLIGSLISFQLTKPFLPIRKKGKLPGKVIEQSYTLEYGEEVFEMQADIMQQGKKRKNVVIVDDLLATGGTMAAAETLLKNAGCSVVECLVVIELTSLNGRAKVQAPVHSLLQFNK